MQKVNPFNDEQMTFDSENQRYYLTREYVKDQLGNNFKDDKMLDRRIKKNSNIIYNYIYKCGNTANRKLVDKLLNYTDVGRKFLIEVLTSQMEADLETGINSIGNIPQLNIKTGQVLDRQAMAEGYISQYTRDIIENSTSLFGINITYAGAYSNDIWLRFRGLL